MDVDSLSPVLTIVLGAPATEPTAYDWIAITGLVVQIVAILAAIGASIIALVVASRVSARDRAHSRLLTELEYAVRLSTNRNHGGSTDAQERSRLGSEALALAMVVGERWVPKQFERATDGKSQEQLANELDQPESADQPQWVKDKMEAGLAIQRIMDDLYGKPKKP